MLQSFWIVWIYLRAWLWLRMLARRRQFLQALLHIVHAELDRVLAVGWVSRLEFLQICLCVRIALPSEFGLTRFAQSVALLNEFVSLQIQIIRMSGLRRRI